METLLSATDLSEGAAKGQLTRLGDRVARVSQMHRFFLIISPEHRSLGSPPVDSWIDDYFGWLGHPYYLALQSAASAYGSNPQAIQVTQIMTDAPRRPVTIGRLRVIFFVKGRIDLTPTQQAPNASAPTRISTPAATSFDLVRYASRIGGIGRAVETFRPFLSRISPAELRAMLKAENETTTAQRLGYLLEKCGEARLATVIEQWLPAHPSLIPLATASVCPRNSPVSPRWGVIDNSGEFEP